MFEYRIALNFKYQIYDLMNDLIKQLKLFAREDFPINEVDNYLNKYQLKQEHMIKYSHFSKEQYTRNLVYRDPNFEILFLCWHSGQIAPIHGHEGEKCWARVECGQLKFCNYNLISEHPLKLKRQEELIANIGYLDGPADIHSVENNSKEKAISLHVYAKPYDKCNIFYPEQNSIKRAKLKYYSKFGEVC